MRVLEETAHGRDGEEAKQMAQNMKDKFILDATAGFREMWFNKNNPHVCFYDKDNDEQLAMRMKRYKRLLGSNRHFWHPKNRTVSGLWSKLPFDDESLYLIVFDPPHKLDAKMGNRCLFKEKYGALQPETWQQQVKSAFSEFHRVLKPYGVLILKWGTLEIPYQHILNLTPLWKPLFGQRTAGAAYMYRDMSLSSFGKMKRNMTFWFAFMKFPEEERREC